MTEEQRYRERIQIEKDKVQLLKRISEALDIIAAPHLEKRYKVDMSEVTQVEKELEVTIPESLRQLRAIQDFHSKDKKGGEVSSES